MQPTCVYAHLVPVTSSISKMDVVMQDQIQTEGSLSGHEQVQGQDYPSTTTEIVPWKYCNVYANNRSPERLFVVQGHSIFIQQRLDEKVTIDQNTGNVVWDGAYLMAKFLETRIKDLQGKTCLELGAGTGLVSIAAWLLGASSVLATDLAGEHIEHVKKNTSTNARRIASERRQTLFEAESLAHDPHAAIIRRRMTRNRDRIQMIELKSKNLQVAALDWSSPTLPDSVPFQGPFSYILCSEILYLPQFHRALLKTLTKFADNHTIVILLWKKRGLGEERFFDIAARPSSGWNVEFLDNKAVLDPEFQDQPYGVAQMTRAEVSTPIATTHATSP
ncbi:Methyltransferase-like protein 21A [Mortierella claussenii]|nr:Methyltransferase-like protein 21A [Mortierella claussenii]